MMRQGLAEAASADRHRKLCVVVSGAAGGADRLVGARLRIDGLKVARA